MSFDSLGLRAELLRAVRAKGYDEATPIQARVIPLILEGRDVMGGAQTGTGKTAGFTLPMLQLLSERPTDTTRRRRIRCLILTPTRELAMQVEESVRSYGRNLPLRSTVIYGGVSMVNQIGRLRDGVDIVVATPGRLLDHVGQRTLDLSHVEMLILDEADRMLDMGFIRDIRRILALLPRDRQSLLFSATTSPEIQTLARDFMISPIVIQVARKSYAPELIEQIVHPVDRTRKSELLIKLIYDGDWRQVLVFTRTKHGADRLARDLEREGLSAIAIHGDKSQGARTQALAQFKRGGARILVATDVAARGLDIDQLPHVVNYELPNTAEDYVHRIGRTGRAGNLGQAVSLYCVDERSILMGIEDLIGRQLPRTVIPGFEPNPSIMPEPITRGRSGMGRGGYRGSSPMGGGQRPGGGGGDRDSRRSGPPNGGSRRTGRRVGSSR